MSYSYLINGSTCKDVEGCESFINSRIEKLPVQLVKKLPKDERDERIKKLKKMFGNSTEITTTNNLDCRVVDEESLNFLESGDGNVLLSKIKPVKEVIIKDDSVNETIKSNEDISINEVVEEPISDSIDDDSINEEILLNKIELIDENIIKKEVSKSRNVINNIPNKKKVKDKEGNVIKLYDVTLYVPIKFVDVEARDEIHALVKGKDRLRFKEGFHFDRNSINSYFVQFKDHKKQ